MCLSAPIFHSNIVPLVKIVPAWLKNTLSQVIF